MVCHGLNGSEPVEFKISFPCHLTYGMLRKQLSQMTGILPADQIIIIKGEEWVMEDREVITVEPLHADTSLIRTPLYYGQFPMYRQNSHTFLLKKTSIIRTLSNTDNGHLISAPGGNFIQT